MGLFDEQILERKRSDQDVFEDSIFGMASAVTGGRRTGDFADERIVTKDAIDDVLKYYHIKPVEIPDTIEDPEEQIEYAMRPHGLMHRVVELSENWYNKAYGPMIAYMKDSGSPVAVYPKAVRGYWYRNADGKRVSLNRSTAKQFDPDAICFYRPLPLRPLKIIDLLLYMKLQSSFYVA